MLRRFRELVVLAAIAAWLVFTAGTAKRASRVWFDRWNDTQWFLALGLGIVLVVFVIGRGSRRTAFRAVFVAFSTLTAWLVLEAAGAVGLVDYPKHFGRGGGTILGSEAVPHLDVRGEGREDTATRWGWSTEAIPFHYRTDARGFRNDLDRPFADVYLVGDSFVVGGLVPFTDTVAARLEAATAKTVMNVALIDLGVQEERDLFLAQNLPVGGRTVVHFVFEGNDLKGSARYRAGKPRTNRVVLPFRKRTLAWNLLESARKWSRPIDPESFDKSGEFRGRRIAFHWTGDDMLPYEAEIPFVLAALDEVRRYVVEHGGRYVVAHVPAKLRVVGPSCTFPSQSAIADVASHLGPLPARLAAWCRDQGVPYLDLTAELVRSVEAGELPYFAADSHWNAIGHRVAAEALAPLLSDRTAPR